jgi:hypothetical protein
MVLNQHEQVRPGFGFQTNDAFSKTTSFGLYTGYGLKDKALKYGGNITFNIGKPSATQLKILYQQDLSEPASTTAIIRDDQALAPDGYRALLISRMDSVQRLGVSFSSHVNTKLSVGFSALQETRNPTYSYTFINDDVTSDHFKTTEITTQLRYAIGERQMNLGRGTFTITRPLTLIEVNLSKAVSISKDALQFLRIQSSVTRSFRSRTFGQTVVHLRGGYAQGQLPYSYLFNGRGTIRSLTFFYLENTFQTMGIYEFTADRYASLFITQNFNNLLWKSGSQYFSPEVKVTHGAYFGQLSHQEKHEGMNSQVASRGFYEGGMIVNKLLRVRYFRLMFIDFGLGAFYRYGAYSLPKQSDNLAFKLIVGASL